MADFGYWDRYWGIVHTDEDSRFPTVIWGFENFTEPARALGDVSSGGGTFGFLQCGGALISDNRVRWALHPGQWFSCPDGVEVQLNKRSRLLVCQRLGFRGVHAMGGPIEAFGRLRYIDGCSDTLLSPPILCGNPCLNLLHFPCNISQTQHTHPSTRAGIVARGRGICVTLDGETELFPGRMFYSDSQ